MRRLAMIGGVLLVLIVAGVVVMYMSLNSIIRSAVETYGPEVTKTEVKLGGVNVSPFTGSARLSNLLIGNPKGYKAPSAFKLGALRMSVDVGSLRSDKVVIRDLVISAPEITYEPGPGGNNLKVIQQNAQAFTGGSGKKAEGAQAKGGETKVVIDRLRVEKPKLHVSAPQLQSEALTLELPDIEMRDIGKKGDGASFSEVVELIMKDVNSKTATAVANVDWKGLAEKALKKEGAGAEGVGKALKGLFGK
jgi:uncharacterized protein involved in outer membrane biogenesis